MVKAINADDAPAKTLVDEILLKLESGSAGEQRALFLSLFPSLQWHLRLAKRFSSSSLPRTAPRTFRYPGRCIASDPVACSANSNLFNVCPSASPSLE